MKTLYGASLAIRWISDNDMARYFLRKNRNQEEKHLISRDLVLSVLFVIVRTMQLMRKLLSKMNLIRSITLPCKNKFFKKM